MSRCAQSPLIQTPDELLRENESNQFIALNPKIWEVICDKPELFYEFSRHFEDILVPAGSDQIRPCPPDHPGNLSHFDGSQSAPNPTTIEDKGRPLTLSTTPPPSDNSPSPVNFRILLNSAWLLLGGCSPSLRSPTWAEYAGR